MSLDLKYKQQYHVVLTWLESVGQDWGLVRRALTHAPPSFPVVPDPNPIPVTQAIVALHDTATYTFVLTMDHCLSFELYHC